MALDIIVVGSGIGGLAAALALTAKGHRVLVLEASSDLQSVGGVTVIQANGCRLLDHLGVYQPLLRICRSKPFPWGSRRYEDGKWLRRVGAGYVQRYGYPLWNVHRADYQRVLYEAAVERGVKVRFDCRVESLDENEPSVITKDGEIVKGDVIIGADGIKSVIRRCMFPESEATALYDTGLDITRVSIPFEVMHRNAETADLTEHIALWFGPRTVVANIPIYRNGDWLSGYDFIAPRSEHSSVERARRQDFDQMKKQFDGWDPRIRTLVFGLVDEERLDTYVWQIHESKPPEWVSKSGKAAIIGDAAHGFTPWLGQGGTMAVEDAVALAECLSYSPGDTCSSRTSPDSTGSKTSSDSSNNSQINIKERLHIYQQIRQPRASAVQARSKAMGELYILPDGPQQEMRDQMLKTSKLDTEPDPESQRFEWVDVMPTPETELGEWDDWIVGFDGVEYTRKKLAEMLTPVSMAKSPRL